MRDKFHAYYRPTAEEFDALWDESLVVLDSNALCNLYTYSESTRNEILQLLEGMQDRLWLPYQAGLEYHKNRCGIITKEAQNYDGMQKSLRGVVDALGARKQHPFVDAVLHDEFAELVEKVNVALKKGKETQSALVHVDPICDRVSEIYKGRIGESFSRDDLEEIYAEGAVRFEKEIPPGFKDAEKSEPERFGDLVIWKEMLRQSSREQKPILFVTDDRKEDWWRMEGSETIGPRPELLEEFQAETGQGVYLYSSETFVENAKNRGKEVSDQAVAELEAARKEREQSARDDEESSRVLTLSSTDASRLRKMLESISETKRVSDSLGRLVEQSDVDTFLEQARKFQAISESMEAPSRFGAAVRRATDAMSSSKFIEDVDRLQRLTPTEQVFPSIRSGRKLRMTRLDESTDKRDESDENTASPDTPERPGAD